MCHVASRYRSRLCSNNGFAIALEKAHGPWHDSIAEATVDWGETISGCGAEECLGRSRRGHVMDVIYVMLRVEQIPGEAEERRSRGESS